MGELGEIWTEHKKERKQKKESNRNKAIEILTENGISFESKNSGAHLIIRHNGMIVEFWPGTGLFISQHGGQKYRGIRNLLKILGKVGN